MSAVNTINTLINVAIAGGVAYVGYKYVQCAGEVGSYDPLKVIPQCMLDGLGDIASDVGDGISNEGETIADYFGWVKHSKTLPNLASCLDRMAMQDRNEVGWYDGEANLCRTEMTEPRLFPALCGIAADPVALDGFFQKIAPDLWNKMSDIEKTEYQRKLIVDCGRAKLSVTPTRTKGNCALFKDFATYDRYMKKRDPVITAQWNSLAADDKQQWYWYQYMQCQIENKASTNYDLNTYQDLTPAPPNHSGNPLDHICDYINDKSTMADLDDFMRTYNAQVWAGMNPTMRQNYLRMLQTNCKKK